MTKRELSLLEKAFTVEVTSAFDGGPGLLHTKSRLAVRMAKEGLLRHVKVTLPGRFPVEIEGYVLTHAGRFLYCANAPEDEPNP